MENGRSPPVSERRYYLNGGVHYALANTLFFHLFSFLFCSIPLSLNNTDCSNKHEPKSDSKLPQIFSITHPTVHRLSHTLAFRCIDSKVFAIIAFILQKEEGNFLKGKPCSKNAFCGAHKHTRHSHTHYVICWLI